MPGITAFKDGASWAALEYAKNIRTKGRELSTGGEVKMEPKDGDYPFITNLISY